MDTYAIVVGIDKYKEKPLGGAVTDAEDFARWLVRSEQIPNISNDPDEPLGDPEFLKLLTCQRYQDQVPPTDIEINNAVWEIFDRVDKKNGGRAKRLYFYFSGHGLGLTYLNTALCMRPWNSFFNGHCISTIKYLEGLAQLNNFDELLFFFDCCRDVDVITEAAGPRWKLPGGEMTTKYMLCFSTQFGNRSQEVNDVDRRRGAFTKFLIKALDGDASKNGEVRVFDLRTHLNKHLKSYTATLRYVQKADVHCNLDDDIVITKVKAAPQEFNVEIEFKRSSNNIELQKGDFTPVRSGSVKEGDKWQVKLPVGINLLIDYDKEEGSEGRLKYFQNHSENAISHEEF
jgi:hypothetical protein